MIGYARLRDPFFDQDAAQRDRARRALGAWGAAVPPFEAIFDHEHLLGVYRALEARNGRAPGPDRVTFDDLGPSEVAGCLRDLSALVLDGHYRPAATRSAWIPKADGDRRRLTIANVLDRVVAAALHRALTPHWETIFLDNSYGFRPRRGAVDLLADLLAAMAAKGRYVLAVDDVRKAFDNVPIAPLMEDHRRHVDDPRLLHTIEAVLRGARDRGRAVGIAQGCPYSPTALNVRLHHVHDLPRGGDRAFPSWHRYADNLAYLCRDVPEGHRALDRARRLLADSGLALKGADGPPADLRGGGAAHLLGFVVVHEGGTPRLRLGEDAWRALAGCLEDAHDDRDPNTAALRALVGWVESYGPAFEDRAVAPLADRILRTAALQGYRELIAPGELRGRCRMAHGRWLGRLEAARRRRGLTTGVTAVAAAPPAHV